MDEWLLDSLHGLHDGDEEEHEVLKPEHFISSLTFKYVSTLQPKQRDLWIEQPIRKTMSRSLWPRILISRCRLLLAHSLPLLSEEHLIEMKKAEAHAFALYKRKLKKLVLNCAVLSASILLFVFKYFMLPSLINASQQSYSASSICCFSIRAFTSESLCWPVFR